jgi:hypothetical protein
MPSGIVSPRLATCVFLSGFAYPRIKQKLLNYIITGLQENVG